MIGAPLAAELPRRQAPGARQGVPVVGPRLSPALEAKERARAARAARELLEDQARHDRAAELERRRLERDPLAAARERAREIGKALGARPAVVAAPASSELGKHTKKVSETAPAPSPRRSPNYALRETLWRFSGDKRLAWCGRRRIDKEKGVTLVLSDGVAHYRNLQLCGSVHSCPVCAGKIRQERANEVARGLDFLLRSPLAWGAVKATKIENPWTGELEKRGATCALRPAGEIGPLELEDAPTVGSAGFLTLTVPHDFGQPLAELLNVVSGSFRAVLGGAGWQQLRGRYGIVGTIRALEATHGRNGWHPHLHVVLAFARPLELEELEELRGALWARWARAVEARGLRRPSLEHGCTLSPIRSLEDVAAYLQKIVYDGGDSSSAERRVGLELTRHDLKRGREGYGRGEGRDVHRTPFQILSDFTDHGDADDLELWREWETATKGTHALDWSRGLKRALGVVERTDEEIAEEEVGGESFVTIAAEEWRAVTRTRGLASRLLELAEAKDAAGIALQLALALEDSQRQDWRDLADKRPGRGRLNLEAQ